MPFAKLPDRAQSTNRQVDESNQHGRGHVVVVAGCQQTDAAQALPEGLSRRLLKISERIAAMYRGLPASFIQLESQDAVCVKLFGLGPLARSCLVVPKLMNLTGNFTIFGNLELQIP
jgi:hypothetical protein